ncbi:MAG: hypothetical protein WA175_03525, partial [Candidatus Acidiferrales bacterium]
TGNNVVVSTTVGQNPTAVKNQTVPDASGKWTGIAGMLVDTVTVNGKPAPGVTVSEENQETITKNGQPAPATLAQGNSTTNANGQTGDIISILHPTNGTKTENNLINQDFKNNTWTKIDRQTLTLTLPSGQTYSATSTRTLSNAGGSGYKLTYTQPVVTGPF